MCIKMKLDHLITSHIRKSPKWMKQLYVRPKTIKIMEESIGSKISDIAHSNILLDISPQPGKQKKNKQMELHQTKKFLHSKGKH